MQIKIIHETEYSYSDAVFFEPHYFRFKPKKTFTNELDFFNLTISPAPAGLSEQSDAENNWLHFCWFDILAVKLSIRAEMTVTLNEYNPFNFLLYPAEHMKIPFSYNDLSYPTLLPAMKTEKLPDNVAGYCEKILAESNYDTITFLVNLTSKLHRDFKTEYRQDGPPHKAEDTFNLKKGSCRDITWMQIQMLRNLGFAAKFVSGYYFVETDNPLYELHAWVEVFLPGAGWTGFDPSNGIAAGEHHIPVVSSVFYENTMPVTGTIRGNASAEMKTNLVIEII